MAFTSSCPSDAIVFANSVKPSCTSGFWKNSTRSVVNSFRNGRESVPISVPNFVVENVAQLVTQDSSAMLGTIDLDEVSRQIDASAQQAPYNRLPYTFNQPDLCYTCAWYANIGQFKQLQRLCRNKRLCLLR